MLTVTSLSGSATLIFSILEAMTKMVKERGLDRRQAEHYQSCHVRCRSKVIELVSHSLSYVTILRPEGKQTEQSFVVF